MEFTALDGAVAVIVLISGILAYARGFMREVLAIAAWVAAAVAGYYFAPQLAPLTAEVPVVGEFLADSCGLRTVVAAAVIFVGALLVLSIFTPLFSGAVQRSALGAFDQALGFLFGVARGLVLVAIALVIYDRAIATEPQPMIDESQTARLFDSLLSDVNEQIPTETPGWATQLYDDFLAHCEGDRSVVTPSTPSTTDQNADQ